LHRSQKCISFEVQIDSVVARILKKVYKKTEVVESAVVNLESSAGGKSKNGR
jgi:hypothetical protein